MERSFNRYGVDKAGLLNCLFWGKTMHDSRIHCRRKKSLFKVALSIVFLLMSGCWGGLDGPLLFPFDHGPHLDVLNEWWYFTGEVRAEEGKRLGFEFTIFKRWVESLNGFAYLGHLAVSDPEVYEHYFAEIMTTPSVPVIEEGTTEIEINNFSYIFSETEGFIVNAEAENLSVDLSLIPSMDVLPHGQDGIIVMGDGKNSFYYSFANLMTTGKISVNGVEYIISSGRTWMDHQWGNFTLFGLFLDWFSLRLDDGSALMLFQFRDIFDNVVRSNWTYRSATGLVEYGEEFSVQSNRIYKDENGNCTYPIDWIVEVPDINAEFVVSPFFDEQSLYDVLTPEYWEGLCSVEGMIGSDLVTGSAYVELTGYDN